jgi:hypothetical protein
VFAARAFAPNALLFDPVVLAVSAVNPIAVLFTPVRLFISEEPPTAHQDQERGTPPFLPVSGSEYPAPPPYGTPAAAFDYEYRAFRKDSTPGSTFT